MKDMDPWIHRSAAGAAAVAAASTSIDSTYCVIIEGRGRFAPLYIYMIRFIQRQHQQELQQQF